VRVLRSCTQRAKVISSHMAVCAKDGTEVEVGPGEAFVAAPGHDAWVVGDEPCIALDFIGTGYDRPPPVAQTNRAERPDSESWLP
jgi:hypothetical protein